MNMGEHIENYWIWDTVLNGTISTHHQDTDDLIKLNYVMIQKKGLGPCGICCAIRSTCRWLHNLRIEYSAIWTQSAHSCILRITDDATNTTSGADDAVARENGDNDNIASILMELERRQVELVGSNLIRCELFTRRLLLRRLLSSSQTGQNGNCKQT